MTLEKPLSFLLSFCQDVSDRIEKESEESDLLVSLQKDSIPVVRGDWKVHLSSELQEGEKRERDWEPMVLKLISLHVSN